MFTFFHKRTFLIDHLEGFVDIHNHILPGIDDGAKTTEESIELIRFFKGFGVKDFICTPHIMHNYYDNTPKNIMEAYQKVKEALKGYDIVGINIKYAAEHMIDDDFEKKLGENLVLPLNENHLLIEMSYLQPSINFNQSVQSIFKKGFFPVLAHPERYQYLNSDKKKCGTLKSQGIKFQLNLLSVGGYYGIDIQKAAIKLLEDNFYEFLGSDVHNLKHLTYLKSIKLKECYLASLMRLTYNNRMLVYS